MIDPELKESSGATSDRQIRQFAWIWLVFFGALAWFKGIRPHQGTVACVLGVLAVVIWLAGVLKPQSIRPLYSLLMAVATPIGWVISNLVLALVFYLVFTPLGWLFRWIGRDPLSLKLRDEPTFWEPMPPADEVRRYYHQY